MEKRVLIAVALSFLVLYGYQAFFPPPKPPVQTVAPPAVTGSATTDPAASSPAAEAESPGGSCRSGARERRRRAGHRRRERRGSRGLHQSRRGAQELGAQAVSGSLWRTARPRSAGRPRCAAAVHAAGRRRQDLGDAAKRHLQGEQRRADVGFRPGDPDVRLPGRRRPGCPQGVRLQSCQPLRRHVQGDRHRSTARR